MDGTTDIGADEFDLRYEVVGVFEPGGGITLRFFGHPGTIFGVFRGSGHLDPPLNLSWGTFCMKAPFELVLLGPMPSNGALLVSLSLPTSPPGLYAVPTQGIAQTGSDLKLTNYVLIEVE